MTQTIVRPEEPMGDGQGWVSVVVDDVPGHYELVPGRSKGQ
jgi:hypothetical protein